MRIGLVRQQPETGFAGERLLLPVQVEQGLQLWVVIGLTGGQDHRDRAGERERAQGSRSTRGAVHDHRWIGPDRTPHDRSPVRPDGKRYRHGAGVETLADACVESLLSDASSDQPIVAVIHSWASDHNM